MLAARFYGGKDIRVEEIPQPEPGPGEVLIRVRAAGICGSDLHGYRDPQAKPHPPRTPGHELAGEIVAVGPGVQAVRVGDRVAVEPLIGCGECAFCRAGQYHLCARLEHIGGARSGGFAEFTVAPVDKVFAIPDQVSFEEAALLDVLAVAVHALSRVPVAPGERVVVIGTGAIGLSIAQMAALSGGDVAVVGRRDEPLEVAKQTANAKGICTKREDPVKAVHAWTDGLGADVVFEAVGGTANTFGQAVAMAAPGGRVGLVGSFREPQTFDTFRAYRQELSLIWVWSYAWRGRRPEFAIALDLLVRGELQAAPLITHRYPLSAIGQAFEAADQKAAYGSIKVVILP